jgi:hypothetical protein
MQILSFMGSPHGTSGGTVASCWHPEPRPQVTFGQRSELDSRLCDLASLRIIDAGSAPMRRRSTGAPNGRLAPQPPLACKASVPVRPSRSTYDSGSLGHGRLVLPPFTPTPAFTDVHPRSEHLWCVRPHMVPYPGRPRLTPSQEPKWVVSIVCRQTKWDIRSNLLRRTPRP